MHRNRALTVTEVVILLAIIVIGLGLLLPMLAMLVGRGGSRHHGGRQMQNSTQLRGIHSGLVLFAQGNNSHYPGIMADGETIDPSVGLTTQDRVQKLIDDNYFTIEYARSPNEVQTGVTSYAMLKIDVNIDGKTIAKSIRNSEWHDTTNTEGIVLSDRAINNGSAFSHIKSVHTTPAYESTDWKGSVGWNDNHVTFESTLNHATVYGSSVHAADNLFTTSDLENGDDAFMVWRGRDGL